MSYTDKPEITCPNSVSTPEYTLEFEIVCRVRGDALSNVAILTEPSGKEEEANAHTVTKQVV